MGKRIFKFELQLKQLLTIISNFQEIAPLIPHIHIGIVIRSNRYLGSFLDQLASPLGK